MNNHETEKQFTYSYFAKYRGSIYGILSITFFSFMPYWSYLIFGTIFDDTTKWFCVSAGIALAIYGVFSDYRNLKLFSPISINTEGINYSTNNQNLFIPWKDISNVETFKYGDKDYSRVFGQRGIRISSNKEEMIYIFNTINNYSQIYNILKQKIEISE